jgi:uncharacterized RDD family membrane protein YckC
MAAVSHSASPTPTPHKAGHHPSTSIEASPAGLGRRFASLIYESLLLTALVLIATFPFVGLTGGKVSALSTHLLQLYLTVVVGTYFIWFWRNGGQTLPMKTWGIRVLRIDGRQLELRDGIVRYAVAWLGLGLAGLGFWWAFWDRDRQFLHDRVAGTRLVDARTKAQPRHASIQPNSKR